MTEERALQAWVRFRRIMRLLLLAAVALVIAAARHPGAKRPYVIAVLAIGGLMLASAAGMAIAFWPRKTG
jgi:heme O synthase-like polyprenyltransferase